MNSLKYSTPCFMDIPLEIPKLNNCCYKIDDNPNGIQKVIFNQDERDLTMSTIDAEKHEYKIRFNFDEAVYDRGLFIKDIQSHNQKYISYARWISASELELQVIYVETPYVVTYWFSFADSTVEMRFSINVSFTLKKFTAFGTLEE